MKESAHKAKKAANAPQLIGQSEDFAVALLAWYESVKEDYPWRRTADPYAILVSELMLQQTRIATVVEGGYYDRWMEKFPDEEALAEASEEELLRYWEGLGYYNRARNLQKAAQHIVGEWAGQWKLSSAELVELPGVGPYTAAAVASFAFGEEVVVVDGNVLRVLARLLNYEGCVDEALSKKELGEVGQELLGEGAADRSGAFNSALMELGQKICVVGQPSCQDCPVAEFCQAADPASLPVKAKRAAVTQVSEDALWVERGGKLLLEKESGSRRRGYWRLPLIDDEKSKQGELLSRSSYSITRYMVTLSVYEGRDSVLAEKEGVERFLASAEDLEELPISAPYRKVIEKLISKRAENASENLLIKKT